MYSPPRRSGFSTNTGYSERLEEGDQISLFPIAESRLFVEVACAEIVATIYDEIRTLAEFHELRHEPENLPKPDSFFETKS
jgi:hypothetical protein